MRFGLDDVPATAAESAGGPPVRELVPEGVHDFQIREVIDHGSRVELRLVHGDRRYGWVFCKPPTDQDWGKRILSTLRTSLEISREQWEAMEVTDLVDRRVRARVYHKPGGQATFVNVAAFLPASPVVETATAAPVVERAVAPPSVRTPPKRTPTQKADAAAAMPDDDIPF